MDAALDAPAEAKTATGGKPPAPGTTDDTCLLRVSNCRQSYHKDASADLVVLDDVHLELQEGEIVALLGRSGSGKSTLLRIVAGLLTPTAGEVRWRGRKIEGPTEGVAMVFQSFALFPWLTVQENVELGLEARGVARAEREKRAEEAIDLIGLGGFESAYPKELSGGMRQRVGLARALVVHPDLLLMDEPFSALDVLTAENLRTDLIDLWIERKLPVKSMHDGHPQHRGSGADGRPHPAVLDQPGPRGARNAGEVPASAQPPRPGVPADGRRHLRPDDAPRGPEPARAGGAGRRLDRDAAAPDRHQPHGRPDGDAGRAALQRPRRPAAAGGIVAARGRRTAAAGRDAATAAVRRAGGGRHPAHRRPDAHSSMPTPRSASGCSPPRCARMCRWST